MPDPLSDQSALSSTEPEQAVEEVREAYRRLTKEVAKVIVGQDKVVEQLLMSMFCRGHALVVGVPGLAKTLLISTIARSVLRARVQTERPAISRSAAAAAKLVSLPAATAVTSPGRRGARATTQTRFAATVPASIR